MSVEKIYTYQEKVDYQLKQIVQQTKVYTELIERIAQLERNVRRKCMGFMQSNTDSKKMSMEKMEAAAYIGAPSTEQEEYLELVYLRVKQHNLEKILESSQSSLSAIQSAMRYERSVDYVRGAE